MGDKKVPTRAKVIRELQRVLPRHGDNDNPNFERFLACPDRQHASLVLARAALQVGVRKHASAFTAATHTPIAAPPGWLPPPI